MGGNKLTGTVPHILGEEDAKTANVVGNIFQATVPEQDNHDLLGTNKTNFQRLVLSNNEGLTGPFPDLSGFFPSLVELGLSSTQMSGQFPVRHIHSLTRLEVLDLRNCFRSPQPGLLQSLTELTNLKVLNLENSKLHENMPTSIGNMVSLGKMQRDERHHNLLIATKLTHFSSTRIT